MGLGDQLRSDHRPLIGLPSPCVQPELQEPEAVSSHLPKQNQGDITKIRENAYQANRVSSVILYPLKGPNQWP